MNGRGYLSEPLALLPLQSVVPQQGLAEVRLDCVHYAPEEPPLGLVSVPIVGQVGHNVWLVPHALPHPLLAELRPEGDVDVPDLRLLEDELLLSGDLAEEGSRALLFARKVAVLKEESERNLNLP